MKLSLFDTHCDTAYELYHQGVHLGTNDSCHISLEKAACYDRYAQYYAVWSNRRLDDETCWEHFLKNVLSRWLFMNWCIYLKKVIMQNFMDIWISIIQNGNHAKQN